MWQVSWHLVLVFLVEVRHFRRNLRLKRVDLIKDFIVKFIALRFESFLFFFTFIVQFLENRVAKTPLNRASSWRWLHSSTTQDWLIRRILIAQCATFLIWWDQIVNLIFRLFLLFWSFFRGWLSFLVWLKCAFSQLSLLSIVIAFFLSALLLMFVQLE